jgi:hypothetical protein
LIPGHVCGSTAGDLNCVGAVEPAEEPAAQETETEVYQCEQCDYETDTEKGVKVHTARRHEGDDE